MLGAARAAEQLGDADLAESYYRQLADIWSGADKDHPFADQVRAKLN